MAVSANSTIVPNLPARVMQRAWAMFRQSYDYPRIPFRSIGRACFADCLKQAWAELREVARLATFGIESLIAAILVTLEPRHGVGLSTSYSYNSMDMLERGRQRDLYEAALELAEAA